MFFVAGLAALLATGFSGAGFFAIGFGAVLGAGFAVVRDPRFAAGLPTGFAVAFVAGESAGFWADLADAFGVALTTGFAAAFAVDLPATGFTAATFAGISLVTLLACFAFVTCSPPLPL